MSGWIWLDPQALLAAHDEQLAEHGGASGIRDQGLFDSALTRPQDLAAGGNPDAAALAAAYAMGLAKRHLFISGRRRIAPIALEAFLGLNGLELVVDDSRWVFIALALSSGDIGEAVLAQWIRQHMRARA
ncbi:MAG: Fic family protein [Rhizomicrobium sp.]